MLLTSLSIRAVAAVGGGVNIIPSTIRQSCVTLKNSLRISHGDGLGAQMPALAKLKPLANVQGSISIG